MECCLHRLGTQNTVPEVHLEKSNNQPVLLNHSIPDDLMLTAEMPDHREPMTGDALMQSIDNRNDGSSEFAQENRWNDDGKRNEKWMK